MGAIMNRHPEAVLEECPAPLEPTTAGVETQPHHLPWLLQSALEQGEIPAHLQHIDDILMWGNTARKLFRKGRR